MRTRRAGFRVPHLFPREGRQGGEKFRSGFTLIELLVVIAIVSLLVSILVPSLQKAREQARNLTCRTNLRCIGTACLIYAEENRGLLPDIKVFSSSFPWNNRTFRWDGWAVKAKLGVYLESNLIVLYCPFNKKVTPEGAPDWWSYQALLVGQNVDGSPPYMEDPVNQPLAWDAAYADWGDGSDCNHWDESGTFAEGMNRVFLDSRVDWKYRDEGMAEGWWLQYGYP